MLINVYAHMGPSASDSSVFGGISSPGCNSLMCACVGLGSCEALSSPHLGCQFMEVGRETDHTVHLFCERIFFSAEAENLSL